MVDVLVMVRDPVRHLDPPRETVVPVEEQCFEPGKVCWKPIACIKAAVVLELPFTWMIEKAKYGLRPEDKIRLREMYGETPHPSPAATPSALGCQLQEQSSGNGKEIHNSPPDCCAQGEGFAGDEEGGGQGSGRPTETREEASA